MIGKLALFKLYLTLVWITIPSVITQFVGIDINAVHSLPLYRLIKESITEILANPEQYKKLLEENRKIGNLQKIFPNSTKFFCDVNGPGRRSKQPPTSVHKLRPGDIDIVGCLGDSLNAGTGILSRDVIGLAVEYKGLAFATGGDGDWRQFFTLPNILKEYNPNLYGYTLGNPPFFRKTARFNVAEPFTMSKHLEYQTILLYNRMKSDPKVDMQKHWKVITIFMGHNDFCSENCYIGNYSQIIKNHKKDVLKVLRFIRDNMPRTYINYIPFANIKELIVAKGTPESCNIMHTFECSCMFRPEFKGEVKKAYYDLIQKWIEADYEVVSRAEFHTKEDFEVSIQPFATFAKLPKLKNGLNDFTHFTIDCFHFSQRGHSAFANMLWNNMLQPEGKKSTTYPIDFDHVECPTKDRPYLATIGNSS